jgi:hypothetical protein
MSQIIIQTQALPAPKVGINIRPATAGDVPFMDSLQKLHLRQVGWMPTKQLAEKVSMGHVLIARSEVGESLGYCMGRDQYFKRDDVGIIYQMNIAPGNQRGYIGAALLKAMFDRAAYGCRLFCCWCAQDIEANHFWEAMGFVPLAYRTGGEKRGKKGTARVHIFWQKRIRFGDDSTPWWYPSKTNSGSLRADRIVLPITPGMHWGEVQPLALPDTTTTTQEPQALPGPSVKVKPVSIKPPVESPRKLYFKCAAPPKAQSKPAAKKPVKQCTVDPKFAAAARELRDRWLEQVNATPIVPRGRYEVGRLIEGGVRAKPVNLLAA